MIEISVPGFKTLRLERLVLDYNGTLAFDGKLLAGVRERLDALARRVDVHVVTADTFGHVREELAGLSCEISVLPSAGQAEAKLDYVLRLGAAGTVAIGNGRNDRLMLEAAALGIAVLGREGTASGAIRVADVVCGSVVDALDLLLQPMRLTATLRS